MREFLQLAAPSAVIIAGSLDCAGGNWLAYSFRQTSRHSRKTPDHSGVMLDKRRLSVLRELPCWSRAAAEDLDVEMPPGTARRTSTGKIERTGGGMDHPRRRRHRRIGCYAPGIAPSSKSRSHGINFLTWMPMRSQARRDFFRQSGDGARVGLHACGRGESRLLQGSGDFAIITGALTAANENERHQVHEGSVDQNRRSCTCSPCAPAMTTATGRSREAQTSMKVLSSDEADCGDRGACGSGCGRGSEAKSGRAEVKVTGSRCRILANLT